MSKYSLIEKALEQVNDATFQHVCNAFLTQIYPGHLQSPGTVIGKEKTRKGRPDAFLLQNNGMYILGEYTTQDGSRPDALMKKLIGDVQGCLEFDALGITREQVATIVLCCNSLVEPDDIRTLKRLTEPYQIPLVVVGIQTLANYLLIKGRVVAREYLNIPFDSGQLLSKQEFIRQYDRKNVATSLDTALVGRQQELDGLVASLAAKDVVIVKGPAGVGKTRLVLQAMDTFLAARPAVRPFYILQKTGTITEDLITLLDPDQPYLLFVDDANRQIQNLLAVLHQQIAVTPHQIKIVATVRDYAKNDVVGAVGDMSFDMFSVEKLSDDSIREILKTEFQGRITPIFLQRIVDISKGNPRMALMAGKISSENPDIDLLKDASSVYEAFFQPIIDQHELFRGTDTIAMKVMGLIAYFFSIDWEEEQDRQILQQFGIPYDRFVDIVYQLEAMELVEVCQRYSVRISEQTLATYFFYRVVIKDQLLRFSDLLGHYFEQGTWRMRDSFHAAYAAFGANKVLSRVKMDLLAYYRSVAREEKQALLFLDVFGVYFPIDVFAFVNQHLQRLPVAVDAQNCWQHLGQGKGFYDHESIMRLLEVHYKAEDPSTLEMALELSLSYVFKKPHLYETLLRKLQEHLRIGDEEGPAQVSRQQVAYAYCAKRRSEGPVFQHLFYYLFDRLLLISYGNDALYERTVTGWRLRTPLQQMRAHFWEDMTTDYQRHTPFCYGVLMHYLDNHEYFQEILLQFDLPYVVTLLQTHFTPCSFADCYFVGQYAWVIQEKGISNAKLTTLQSAYETDLYRLFLLLANGHFEEKASHWQFDSHEKMMMERKKAVQEALPVASLDAYKALHQQLLVIQGFAYHNRYSLTWSQDVLLACLLDRDPHVGWEVLVFYLQSGNPIEFCPCDVYRSLLQEGSPAIDKMWHLLQTTDFTHRSIWRERYFVHLPESAVTSSTIQALLNHYATVESEVMLYYGSLDKFRSRETDIYIEVLHLLAQRRAASEQFKYSLGYLFFRSSKDIALPTSLCQQAYLQLEQMDRSFDNDSQDFFVLLERDNGFLAAYVTYMCSAQRMMFPSDYKPLGKIWQYAAAEDWMDSIYQQVAATDSYNARENLMASFFMGIDATAKERAAAWVQKMLREHGQDVQVVNACFNILRHYLIEWYPALVQEFLRQHSAIELFKEVQLLNNHFSSTGDVIWEDVRAEELRRLHVAVRSLPQPTKYLPHLQYLSERIDWEERMADRTRRLRFRRLAF